MNNTTLIVIILFLSSACLMLINKFVCDYTSIKKLPKVLEWSKIKVIRIEDIIENGTIRKLSKEVDFLHLLIPHNGHINAIFDEAFISSLQEQLLMNRYFITFGDLKEALKVLEAEGFINFSSSIKSK